MYTYICLSSCSTSIAFTLVILWQSPFERMVCCPSAFRFGSVNRSPKVPMESFPFWFYCYSVILVTFPCVLSPPLYSFQRCVLSTRKKENRISASTRIPTSLRKRSGRNCGFTVNVLYPNALRYAARALHGSSRDPGARI